jgi:hypothetical protein
MCRKIAKFRQEKKHRPKGTPIKIPAREREIEREEKKYGNYNANQMISFRRVRN